MKFLRPIICLCLAVGSSHCVDKRDIASGNSASDDGTKAGDDDTPDKSAPVSGAYLTCYVPPPKDQSEYALGGCQMRAKSGKRVDLRHEKVVAWKYAPPKGSKTKNTITAFDLTRSKTPMYFDVIYRLKLPAKGAPGVPTTGPGSRVDLTNYFLHSSPAASASSTTSAKTSTQTNNALRDKNQTKSNLSLAGSNPCADASFACLGAKSKAANPALAQQIADNPSAGLGATAAAGTGGFVPNPSASWVEQDTPPESDLGIPYDAAEVTEPEIPTESSSQTDTGSTEVYGQPEEPDPQSNTEVAPPVDDYGAASYEQDYYQTDMSGGSTAEP